jgi:hypothetical protein
MSLLGKNCRPVQINIEDYRIKILCRQKVMRVICLCHHALLLLMSHCGRAAGTALQICPQQYNDSVPFSDFCLSTNLIL